MSITNSLGSGIAGPTYWPGVPGQTRPRTISFRNADGDLFDPGTVTVVAGPRLGTGEGDIGEVATTIGADIDHTGTGVYVVTWPVEKEAQRLSQPWRLRIDGIDKWGGSSPTGWPEGTPSTDAFTVVVDGDDEITITVLGDGGGSARQDVASVILYAATLSLEAGDPIYRISYRPGWVDEGERVPNDWSVDEAYEWGDDFTPDAGGTKVLVLLPGEQWPSVFALATEGALTPVTVAGGTQITVGCGGTDGPADFASAIWIGWNLDGFENSTDPSAPAGLFIPQAIGAKQVHLGSDRTGALADIYDLDQLADALDSGEIGGGAAGATHKVGVFASDTDMSGGTWTYLPIYRSSNAPREYVPAGTTVLVVDGDDLGLWTTTASGPCTPGPALAPGDIVVPVAGGVGWVALATSTDAVTVAGITVTATVGMNDAMQTQVDGLDAGQASLSATVGTQGATLATVTNEVGELAKLSDEAANGLDMLTTAAVTTPPLAWAECGWGNTVGDQERGYWRCSTLLPRPTTSLFSMVTARSLSGSTEEEDLYQELRSECLDSGGVAGAGGNDDLHEFALRTHNGRLSTYDEWSAYGTLMEWHRSQDPAVPAPEGFGVPPKTWVTVAVAVPDFSTGTILMLALSDHGMYVDPWLNLRWKVLQTYEMGEPFTLAESNGVEQWIGRGGGRFDVARSREFRDDVEVSDFDALMGANGGTTITDSVLLDESEDPAVWEAQVNAVNVNND